MSPDDQQDLEALDEAINRLMIMLHRRDIDHVTRERLEGELAVLIDLRLATKKKASGPASSN